MVINCIVGVVEEAAKNWTLLVSTLVVTMAKKKMVELIKKNYRTCWVGISDDRWL